MALRVTYKWTRGLSMRIVKNGDVHVTAPMGLPKRVVEEFIASHRDWITAARAKTAERQQQRADFYAQLPLSTQKQRAEAVARLEAIVKPMVAHHAMVMNVEPSAITYRKMVSRWGMCNVHNHTLCFSLYLLLLPQWCIEHVVVHELCHLLVPSHNDRFHALMDRYFPRWREARKETRAYLQAT